jgi:hypothetical protein
MPENPEVKVTLTAEDQGVSAAIRQLSTELKGLQARQDQTAASAVRTTTAFKGMAAQALSMVKLRLANIPGLGGLGSVAALRAYEPVGKMLEKGAGDIEEKFGAAAIAIGGTAAAVAALGVVAVAVTHHMMDLAQSIENTAAATGLTTDEVQAYTELAKEMNVDSSSLNMAFATINRQLGEFVSTGKTGAEGSEMLLRVMKQLGIALQDTSGNARPAQAVMSDFYDALQRIPDQAARTQLALEALGSRGAIFVEMFDEATREGISFRDLLNSIAETGPKLTEGQIANNLRDKLVWDERIRSAKAFLLQIEEIVGFSASHPIKAFLELQQGGPAGAAGILGESMIPPAGTKPGAGAGGMNAEQIEIQTQTDALQTKLETLRAGGELQLQLRQDEIRLAAAQKQGQEGVANALKEQIADLSQIISLEAAAKDARSEKSKARKAEEQREAAARAAQDVALEANEAISGEIAKRIELQDRQWDKEREQERARLGFQEQLLEAEGKTFDSAVLKIRQEEDEYYRAGGTVADVNAYVSAEMTKVKADIARQNAEKASTAVDVSKSGFGLEREAISDRLAAGQITDREAEQQYLGLVRQEIPLLEQKARLELEAARASGDQQRILDAERSMRSIQQLSQETTEMGQKWKTTLGTSMTSVLDQFTGRVLYSVRSIGQAFGQMELAVVSALERTAMQMLVNYLTQKSIAEGTKLSDAETAAANVYAQVSAIPVVGWIMAPVAAAAAFATVLAFKRGGLVDGPGGPTGDRVPAMLSAGEFVVNARAVNSIGAHNLEAINAGIATTSPNFAASIAHPGDFRAPAFQPEAVERSAVSVDNSIGDIHLHHNGPDAREVLEAELVPRILHAHRMGKLPTP